ncbi:aldose epimerase family protein [Streptococcus himalayensis]|uniref:Aldose 1-epimerase n=1 Tax=Streptococcus himalayensis TaxID=1888195 RepID=A0A917ECL0_9STRE|nr:aldose epimerase family protein [Streptococcus himalayensis]GGE23678.1 aldose 1-epimerase [Streptococcus himalayensis]
MRAIRVDVFGQINGQEVHRYQLENEAGYRLSVMNYGATILEYQVPDRLGMTANIIVGYDSLQAYIGNSPKHGASIGPVAGRIGQAQFTLQGESYELEVNHATNCNHSGSTGWDSSIFQLEEKSDKSVTFYLERPDGTGGFPGNLKIWVTYGLSEEGEVEVSYQVQTDRDTLINPTNHSYFNLSGNVFQTVDDHELTIYSRGVYPVDEVSLPALQVDGQAEFVKNLQTGVGLGKVFASQDPQIAIVNGGLDHPFLLDKSNPVAVRLYHPSSGRELIVRTDCPVAVVYTANYPDNHGENRPLHNGIALEMQRLPNAIHRPEKEQVILRAGEIFTSTTTYQASVVTV